MNRLKKLENNKTIATVLLWLGIIAMTTLVVLNLHIWWLAVAFVELATLVWWFVTIMKIADCLIERAKEAQEPCEHCVAAQKHELGYWILNGGFLVQTGDANHCPFCGRKLGE